MDESLHFKDDFPECELLFEDDKCIQKLNIQVKKEVASALIKTLSTGWKAGQDKRSFTFDMWPLNDDDDTLELIEVNSKSSNKDFLEKVMKLIKVSNGVFHYEMNPAELPKHAEDELQETDSVVVERSEFVEPDWVNACASPSTREIAIQTDSRIIKEVNSTRSSSTKTPQNNRLLKNLEVSKILPSSTGKLTDSGTTNSNRLCSMRDNSSMIIEDFTSEEALIENCTTKELKNHSVNPSCGKENENPTTCLVNEGEPKYWVSPNWSKHFTSTPLREIVPPGNNSQDRILRELRSLDPTPTDNFLQNRPPVIIRNEINRNNETKLFSGLACIDDVIDFPENNCSVAASAEVVVVSNAQQEITAEDLATIEVNKGCERRSLRSRKLRSNKSETSEPSSSVPIVLSPSQHDDMTKHIFNTEVEIGPNKTKIPGHIYYNINWKNYRETTRKLLMSVFTRDVLASHNLTGKPSPAFLNQNKPSKPQLDYEKVADIVHIVVEKCKVDARTVRSQITMKCADENKMLKQKLEKQKQKLLGLKKEI